MLILGSQSFYLQNGDTILSCWSQGKQSPGWREKRISNLSLSLLPVTQCAKDNFAKILLSISVSLAKPSITSHANQHCVFFSTVKRLYTGLSLLHKQPVGLTRLDQLVTSSWLCFTSPTALIHRSNSSRLVQTPSSTAES